MKSTRSIGRLCALGTLFCAFLGCQTGGRLSLRETNDLYIRSIQERDLERLMSSVTEDMMLHFIGTTGTMMKSREDYLRFHEEWFRETDWEISFDDPIIQEVNGFGYTMSVFTYRNSTPDGKVLTLVSYVTLIFRKEAGQWRVIADVCTPIRREVE
jgi:ketosteroid isomerase-like protein